MRTGNYTHWSARAARHAKYARYDIYGNDLAAVAQISEMHRVAEARMNQRLLDERARRHAQPEWHRPMGMDEQFVPGTRIVFDYGKLYDPEPVQIMHKLDTL